MLSLCDATLHPCSLANELRASLYMGVGMELQMFSPYGAKGVVRCSLFVKE